MFLHMTVDENLDMGAYTQPASTIAANKEKVFTLFPRLKERRKQLAGTMSGGEQQMLAMGRALMSNASMLMLDEPSMGLSPLLVQEIFDIIQNIHKEGMTILLVEQNAQMALSVADRAYVLETGRVVMERPGAHLRTNPRRRNPEGRLTISRLSMLPVRSALPRTDPAPAHLLFQILHRISPFSL